MGHQTLLEVVVSVQYYQSEAIFKVSCHCCICGCNCSKLYLDDFIILRATLMIYIEIASRLNDDQQMSFGIIFTGGAQELATYLHQPP